MENVCTTDGKITTTTKLTTTETTSSQLPTLSIRGRTGKLTAYMHHTNHSSSQQLNYCKGNVSLGDLNKQWKMFVQQMARSQQLLNLLQQKPLAPSYRLWALQAELANWQHLFIVQTTHPHSNSTTANFNGMSSVNKCIKRSPLTFLSSHPQLAYQNSNEQRCKGHQEECQPTHWNTNSSTGYFRTCHLNIKH